MAMSRVKFDRVLIETSLKKMTFTERRAQLSELLGTPLSPGYRSVAFVSGTRRRTIPPLATQHDTSLEGGWGTNTWFSTDGGRHTDGKDEQTARRRTRSLQSLPRRWRWRWRKSGGCGERKGFRAPPPPPPPPLPSPLPPPSTPLPRQKGMSDSISKGARTRIMHVAGLDRGER